MKVIYCPLNKPYSEQWGLSLAFLAKTDCRVFDFVKKHTMNGHDAMIKELSKLIDTHKP